MVLMTKTISFPFSYQFNVLDLDDLFSHAFHIIEGRGKKSRKTMEAMSIYECSSYVK